MKLSEIRVIICDEKCFKCPLYDEEYTQCCLVVPGLLQSVNKGDKIVIEKHTKRERENNDD